MILALDILKYQCTTAVGSTLMDGKQVGSRQGVLSGNADHIQQHILCTGNQIMESGRPQGVGFRFLPLIFTAEDTVDAGNTHLFGRGLHHEAAQQCIQEGLLLHFCYHSCCRFGFRHRLSHDSSFRFRDGCGGCFHNGFHGRFRNFRRLGDNDFRQRHFGKGFFHGNHGIGGRGLCCPAFFQTFQGFLPIHYPLSVFVNGIGVPFLEMQASLLL